MDEKDRFRKSVLKEITTDTMSSAKRKRGAIALLKKEDFTEDSLMNLLKTTGQIIQKGKGIREDYESRKYKKGSIWYTGGNSNMRERGIAFVKVRIVNTYKTYSSSGYTNWTYHVEILEGQKKGKKYRLSNTSLYDLEELT